jgi:hypothetical protein
MAEIDSTRLPFAHTLVYDFCVLKDKASFDLFWFHGHQLDAFYQIVTEPTVETALNNLMFFRFPFWERCHHVDPHQATAIVDDIEDYHEDDVTQPVEDP